MATYKEIKGTGIQFLDADPANPLIGQVWYNTTSSTLKGTTAGAGAWASGGSLPTVAQAGGGAGTQTAGLAYGGNLPGSPAISNKSYS